MVFSVKYRDSSGAVCEKAVEAANRTDCFAKCKAQGIVPIAVESDSAVAKKSGKGSAFATGSKPKPLDMRFVLVAVALVAAGAVVWLLPSGKTAVGKEDTLPELTRKPVSRSSRMSLAKLRPRSRKN